MLCFGCGDDDEKSPGAGGMAGGAGNSPCQEGCVLTLQADCDNGPASQAECETDCEELRAGPCGQAYQALQACAEGQAVTCNTAGIPVIEACSTEQGSFIDCLN